MICQQKHVVSLYSSHLAFVSKDFVKVQVVQLYGCTNMVSI